MVDAFDVHVESVDGGDDGAVGFDDADDQEVVAGEIGDAASQCLRGVDVADRDDRRSPAVAVERLADLDGLVLGVV